MAERVSRDKLTGRVTGRTTMAPDVWEEVRAERERQDAKWGEQNQPLMEWLPILMEEVGEAARAALEIHFHETGGPGKGLYTRETLLAEYRSECVQVAAVAVAMIESFDRNEQRETE